MDILSATQRYVDEMVRLSGPGMKAFLMDKDTTSIISCSYAQSEMMQKEVYLFERIDSNVHREAIKFLKCIVFLRPTSENVQLLSEELRAPKYAQYYIYFSNVISKADIKLLAESDEQETVREVREFYADMIPLAPHLAVFNVPNIYEGQFVLSTSIFRRCLQALTAILLSFNKKPIIRYQKSSNDARRLAEQLVNITVRDDTLFERSKSDALLIILDRSEDPVSPLLNQWTYEAMVHELIGLNNNRVVLESTEDKKNFVLSPRHDDFYAKNMYMNFGDIGQNIKGLMNDYQRKTQTHQQLESINDMKRFIEQYPQFKKISGTVSKHVQLVGELSRIVAAQNLLETSELEQNIAVASGEHSICFEALRKLLQNPKITDLNALRLTMLYALRFEGSTSSSNLNAVYDAIRHRGGELPASHYIGMIQTLLRYAGSRRRHSDIFGNRSAMEMTKRFIKGLKGVENIYTQHEPYIVQLIDQASRGRLPETIFHSTEISQINNRFENIIIFVIGGCTFEESAAVHAVNARRTLQGQPQVVLCSNCVHNTRSFVRQFSQLTNTSTCIDISPALA